MIHFPDETKIDHRKLTEACDCFNALIEMHKNLHEQEQYTHALIIHETAMELAEEIANKLR